MKESSENQRSNGKLSKYFSPGSKVRNFYIPHQNSTVALETPMKPSQIPNRLPHQPPRRSLALQSSEQQHWHRQQPFGTSPSHPPQPAHHDFGQVCRRDGEYYTHKQPQQHYPRAQVSHGPVHHRHPENPLPNVLPPPHMLPLPNVLPPPNVSLPVNPVNHTCKNMVFHEKDPPEKSTDAGTILEHKDKPQQQVESGLVKAGPTLEQNKACGHPVLNQWQKDQAPRQHHDSWSSSSSDQALPRLTDLGRRASFSPSHSHTKTENQHHELDLTHASHTRNSPQKRRRESESDSDNKKPCPFSFHPDKTVKCLSADVPSPHRQSPSLEPPKTPENHPQTTPLHEKAAKPFHSQSHGPKLGVKQACIKSKNKDVLILTSQMSKSKILTKAHKESKKVHIPTSPSSHSNDIFSNKHHTMLHDKSQCKISQVVDKKMDLNCNKPVMKRSTEFPSSRKPHRPKKPLISDDISVLFTPDPVYIVNNGQKTLKAKPDDKAKISSSDNGSSSISNHAQTLASKVFPKENASTPDGCSAKTSHSNQNYPDFIQISMPSVNITRLVLPFKTEKDTATSKKPTSAGQSEELEEKVIHDDSLDLDLELDLNLDLETRSTYSSDTDEQLVSLQEIMRSKKPLDTPEKGAFSEPSTPGIDKHKRQHHTLSTAKTGNYKNNLDQMLRELTTIKKAKEMETELITACQEDLLRIAEFEEAEMNKEEPLSAEHQEILQRYSLLTSAIREVPPGHEVFNLEKFGRIFSQNTLQLRQCALNPKETAQKTLLWSSHAQFKLYVSIGLFQEAYECSPCPVQITRFLFKMMCVHSDRMLSVKILQVLIDIAYIAATQTLNGSDSFRVWVPSLADVSLVLLNMGVPFVSLFPLETLQPAFVEGDLLENIHIKSETPSNQTPSPFPEHNCNNMFKYLDCCLGMCPRAYSDSELLLLLTVLCTVSLETHFILQASVELEPLLYKLLNSIRRWDDMMPKICIALTNLTDDHHNMCHLVQLLPEHPRGKNLRRHLSLTMISKLLDGNCTYRPKAKELQLCDLRLYVCRMNPSSLLRSSLLNSDHSEGEEDMGLLDQQAYYLCYSLLTLTNEATNVQFFPPQQKKHLLYLCSELERHVKCHIRESEKCLYRSKVKDLVARIYTKWQILVHKTRPLNGQLYDFWQPPEEDSGGSQDIEEIESSQDVAGKNIVSVEEVVEILEEGAKVEDNIVDLTEEQVTQKEESITTVKETSLTNAASEVVDEDMTEEGDQREETHYKYREFDQLIAKQDEEKSPVEEERKASCTFKMDVGEACIQEDSLCDKDMETEHTSEENPSLQSECKDMQRHIGDGHRTDTALLPLLQTS